MTTTQKTRARMVRKGAGVAGVAAVVVGGPAALAAFAVPDEPGPPEGLDPTATRDAKIEYLNSLDIGQVKALSASDVSFLSEDDIAKLDEEMLEVVNTPTEESVAVDEGGGELVLRQDPVGSGPGRSVGNRLATYCRDVTFHRWRENVWGWHLADFRTRVHWCWDGNKVSDATAIRWSDGHWGWVTCGMDLIYGYYGPEKHVWYFGGRAKFGYIDCAILEPYLAIEGDVDNKGRYRMY